MMVHDLKSLLATISLYLQMIQRETGKGLPDQLAQDTQTAESSVNMMIRMINSILDISKMEEGAKMEGEARSNSSCPKTAVKRGGELRISNKN